MQQHLIWLAILSFSYWLYDFNDTRFQKKKTGFFLYYWLILRSYHIIQILISPIGSQKMFSGSQIKVF